MIEGENYLKRKLVALYHSDCSKFVLPKQHENAVKKKKKINYKSFQLSLEESKEEANTMAKEHENFPKAMNAPRKIVFQRKNTLPV